MMVFELHLRDPTSVGDGNEAFFIGCGNLFLTDAF